MSFTASEMMIWGLGVVVHACLAAVLVIKSRWREYPLFTCFVAFQNLSSPLLYVAFRFTDYYKYRTAFWLFEACRFLLELAVAGEMFASIWKRAVSLKFVPLYKLVLWGCISLLIASISSFLVGTTSTQDFARYAMRGAVFTSFLLSAVFVGVSLECNKLRLRRAGHSMIIGWGLTGIALLELSEDYRFYTLGWHWSSDVYDQIRQVLYACIVVYWLIGLWRQDPLSWLRAGVVLPARGD